MNGILNGTILVLTALTTTAYGLTALTVATARGGVVTTTEAAPFIDNSSAYCRSINLIQGDVTYPCVKEA